MTSTSGKRPSNRMYWCLLSRFGSTASERAHEPIVTSESYIVRPHERNEVTTSLLLVGTENYSLGLRTTTGMVLAVCVW